MPNPAKENNEKKRKNKKIKTIKSILNPEDTFFYYKGKHIGTLKISDKEGKLGISFKFENSDKK